MKKTAHRKKYQVSGIKYQFFGFTLIELLVVISIIGLLATLLMANLNTSRARARDAQRKSDIRNIQTALRLYYNDYGEYPDDGTDSVSGFDGSIVGCNFGDGLVACAWGGSFSITGRDPYMAVLPADPLPDRRYHYTRIDANDTYELGTCMENKSDARCDPDASCGVNHSTDPDSGNAPDGCLYWVKP